MSGASFAALEDLIRAAEVVVKNAQDTVEGVGAASHLSDKERESAMSMATGKLVSAKKLLADIRWFKTSYGSFS